MEPQPHECANQFEILKTDRAVVNAVESEIEDNPDENLEGECEVVDDPDKPTFTPSKHQKKQRSLRSSKYEPTILEDSVLQVQQRFKRGCECQDDQCFKGLNPEAVYRHRLNIAELTKAEHDMYLMGVTMACLTDPYQTARHTERRRLRAQYVYQGRRVCLDAFLYLENVTHYQIKRIRKHLITQGVTPRVHGNHGKIPHNTFSLDIYKIATEFLKNFIQQQEVKLKTKAVKNTPLHLPPEISRKTVHDMYKEYCKKLSPSIKFMGYSTFRRFMKVQFPQVKFPKLEFVVRTPGAGQGKIEMDVPEDRANHVQFVPPSSDIVPIVIASGGNCIEQSNAYFITPVNKLLEGVSYQLTTSGLLVNRSGLPVTVTNITSI